MTPTTKRFAWHDRDTAARDLLQLATYAPPTIRARALRLLRHIRSPAILPELEQIILDESCDIWERHYAFCAIAAVPGDLYLPQYAEFSNPEHELFNAAMAFANNHPRNLQWVFHEIDRLPHQFSLKSLVRLIQNFSSEDVLNPILFQRIVGIVEKYPMLLDLEVIETLYRRGSCDLTQDWFCAQSKSLIYVCLTSEISKSFDLLDTWAELREAVLKNCVSLRDEYTQKKQMEEVAHPYVSTPRNYQLSELWQNICLLYNQAQRDYEVSFKRLVGIASYETENTAKRAIATYFLGKLRGKYDIQTPLISILRTISNEPQYRNIGASVRFEAGNALCEIPSPAVWEDMIDIFLTLTDNSLEGYLPDWIAYLTDYLSGIETPSRPSRGSEEQRMLRYTFDDMHPENQEMLNQRRER